MDRKVHLTEPPSGEVHLLAIDGELIGRPAVRAQELCRLDEQSARATRRVEDAPFVRLQHLDQKLRHGLWGVELACTLAFGGGEARDEVFVCAAEVVARFLRRLERD